MEAQTGVQQRLIQFLRRLRGMMPASRERQLRAELRFWRRWLQTKGLEWPEDYARRFDPKGAVQGHLAPIIDAVPQSHVEILDVGSGPATKVGAVHPTKTFSVTATDVLAREYEALLAQFGAAPPVPTRYAAAERLREVLGDRQFDIVHAQNSLDHGEDPLAAIEEMLALTRPGGFTVLLHAENEGRNEEYYGLHQWDFTCEGSRFVIAGPGRGGPRRDVSKHFAGRAETLCSIEGGMVLVTMRKRPAT
jgi:SAM-dependent methyltransferase